MKLKLLIPILTLFMNPSLFASDHIDGVPNFSNPQTDLTDLYAFPTPNKENSLTVILNVYPGVGKKGHFSNKVNYNIFVRETLADVSAASLFQTDSESQLTVTCSFHVPHHSGHGSEKKDEVACRFIKASLSNKPIELKGEIGKAHSSDEFAMKLFAGRKLDPFFFSLINFQGVTGREEFVTADQVDEPLTNVMDTAAVLTVALEINMDLFFASRNSRLYAVAAESLNNADNKVIDRVGRPEITNLSLHRFQKKNHSIKRYYNNTVKSFSLASEHPPIYKKRLKENISAYDMLANGKNWNEQELDLLIDVLLEDFLVVDLSGDCTSNGNNYFEIEKHYLTGSLNHASCGGRKLTDDVMATLYSLYLGGLGANYREFQDGVTSAYFAAANGAQLSSVFPYLADAKLSLSTQAWIGMFYLKTFQDGEPLWGSNPYPEN